MQDPDAGLQIIYAARVVDLLPELDSEKLRKLAQKCFPTYNRQFPRLEDKQGRCNKAVFLGYLNKRLDDHAMEVPPEFVYDDHVHQREREFKMHELEHL